jgi:hypothetical protein
MYVHWLRSQCESSEAENLRGGGPLAGTNLKTLETYYTAEKLGLGGVHTLRRSTKASFFICVFSGTKLSGTKRSGYSRNNIYRVVNMQVTEWRCRNVVGTVAWSCTHHFP